MSVRDRTRAVLADRAAMREASRVLSALRAGIEWEREEGAYRLLFLDILYPVACEPLSTVHIK